MCLHFCRIIQDDQWIKAISPHVQAPFTGMICINHFSADSLLQATKSLPVRLKKGVVPTIFDSIEINKHNLAGCKKNEVRNVADVAENVGNIAFEVAEDTEITTISDNQTNHNEDGSLIRSTNEDNELMQIEYENLKKEYLLQRTCHHFEILKLQNENDRLKTIIRKQTSNVNRLNHQVTRVKSSNNALNLLLQDLKQRSLLNEEALNALQVQVMFLNIF